MRPFRYAAITACAITGIKTPVKQINFAEYSVNLPYRCKKDTKKELYKIIGNKKLN